MTKFAVGDRVLVNGEEMLVIVSLPEIDGNNEYIVVEAGDATYELWYGKSEYYLVEGWHGVDGEGPQDEPGISVLLKN